MSFPFKSPLALTGIALAGMLTGSVANAVSDNVTVEVEFVAPVTVGKIADLRFGSLDSNMADTETVTINADNSAPNDPGTNILGGVQGAAELTVTATPGEAIQIEVQNVTNGDHKTLSAWRCSYNGATAADCSTGNPLLVAGGSVLASATVSVGATLTADGTVDVGPANGSFDLDVIYQ